MATQFAAARNVDELFTRTMLSVRQVLAADRATLFLVDQQAGVMWSKVADFKDTITVPIGSGLVGSAAAAKSVINLPDAHDDPRFDASFDRKSGYRTRSVLCVPIFSTCVALCVCVCVCVCVCLCVCVCVVQGAGLDVVAHMLLTGCSLLVVMLILSDHWQ